MRDSTLKIRIDKGELEAWMASAVAEGLSLSAWIRKRCNEEGEVLAKITEKSSPRPPKAQEPAPRKAVKKCVHGTEKGYNCWQCGGLAVINA